MTTPAFPTVGIVGTGAMGRGIAQIAAQAGSVVRLFDTQPDAVAKAQAALGAQWDKLAEKGKLTPDAAAACKARLTPAAQLAALADCDLVVEAIVERLDVKKSLFAELEGIVQPGAVLATNTSSLSVTAIAAGLKRPQQFAGYHFFNPVPLMKVVECIAGLKTDPAVCQRLADYARQMGHTPVQAADTPGFIVNHAGRGFGTEALRLLGENVAAPHVIDAVLREQAGFKLGPFELLDLTGLDVSVPVMESIYRQYFDEPRFRPSPLAAQRRVAGLLGRKSGEGYYRYAEGRAVPPPQAEAPAARPASVWLSSARPALAERARELLASLGVTPESGARPSDAALCIVTPLGDDVTQCCVAEALDATRTVGLDMLFDNRRHRSLLLSPLATAGARDAAHGLLASDGARVGVLRDSAGAVAQRVVATIVNIGCDIAQQGIASPDDIDRAVTLGLGYPYGPLAWGDRLGAATVLEVLANMHALSGDPRYRASPWLRRRAALGVSLLTPEP